MIAKISIKGKENVYNIANGKNIKLIDLAENIKKIIKCSIV